jgi:hypothetical protein
MATILSKEQIRALYGVIGKKGEVVAYGRSVKNTMASTRRSQMAADLKTMSQSEWRTKYHDEIMRLKTTPAAPVLESQVRELTF